MQMVRKRVYRMTRRIVCLLMLIYCWCPCLFLLVVDTSGDDSWELMDSIEGQVGDDREASSGLHSFIDRIRKMIQ